MATLYDERKKGRKVADDAIFLSEIEPPAKGRRILADSHRDAPKGFALRVNANGSCAFVLRYMHAGKDRLLTVGEWPTWSLAAARAQASMYRQRIDAGHDLLEERRGERSEPTVSDVCNQFLAAKRKGGMQSVDDIESLFRLYLLPKVGQKRLKTVRRRDVIALIEPIADQTPRQASMLLAYTKQMFTWAEDRELIEANPVATLRAEKISSALVQRTRARVLDAEEIANFWNTVDGVGIHRLSALALKMILLTGQRPGEVAGMEWAEIQGRTWHIPARRRKTGTAHTVPLTDTALDLLESARAEAQRLSKRRKTDGSEYVFEARPGKPITPTSLSRAVRRFADALGIKDNEEGHWRPHDLRRTARTGLAAAGVSETVAEAVIGHTRQGVIGVYDRHGYEGEKRAALEAWERRLLNIASGGGDNVIPFRAQGR